MTTFNNRLLIKKTGEHFWDTFWPVRRLRNEGRGGIETTIQGHVYTKIQAAELIQSLIHLFRKLIALLTASLPLSLF